MIPILGAIIPNMGIMKIGLSEALFTKTQRRVLGLLFGNPDRSYYANEIMRFASAGIGAVQRELEKLSDAGLVTVKRIGNQKHYQANRDCPIFDELVGIIRKTAGLADVLREALAPLRDEIELAFIFGSVAQGKERITSDVDVFVMGAVPFASVVQVFTQTHERLRREINPVVMPIDVVQSKFAVGDRFVTRVVKEPKIFLIGNDNDLRKLIKDRTTKKSRS